MTRPTVLSRRISAVALPLTLAAVLAGCSSADDSAESAAPGADTSLSDVLDAGELVVATEGTYRPFSFHEDGTGDLVGYDVEIARAVAAELGVEAAFEETQWDAIFTGLDAGRFDMIANQVSITPEREAAYTFSAPYTYSSGVVVVRADDETIASFADLDGKTAAQSLTSNWRTLAEDSGARIEAVEGWAQSVALVEQGRVDATVNDELTFLDYRKQTGAEGLKIAATTTDQSRSAFAFRAGSTALAEAVDEALAELAADGTLAAISATYFGQDVSQ
ncbi:amino acid ABC transporter substrate-binding protein [Actinotalea sp.]|uniref:amino acid ABC transporter substrate-binding protein n=1 Tax=Actinotalea sp. TaxID=1872145 RepID=UPI00356164C9